MNHSAVSLLALLTWMSGACSAEAPVVDCGSKHVCYVALLSLNPAVLVCPGASQHPWINWTFQGVTGAGYSTPIIIQTSRAPSSGQIMTNPGSGVNLTSVIPQEDLTANGLGLGPKTVKPFRDGENLPRQALGFHSSVRHGATVSSEAGRVQVLQSPPEPRQARPLRVLPPPFRHRNYLASRMKMLRDGPSPASPSEPLTSSRLQTTAQNHLDELQSRLRGGGQDLVFAEMRVHDTGLYTCRAGGRTLARLEVEVQDVGRLRLSHASHGPPSLPRGNLTARPGSGRRGEAEVFTLWGAWQRCNRCGAPGERKRVGLCYARMSNASAGVGTYMYNEALPCGAAQRRLGVLQGASVSRGPEVLIETCRQTCPNSGQYDDVPTFLRMLHLSLLRPVDTAASTDTLLRCPSSSIYSPIYWERDSQPLTQLDLLQANSTHSLDLYHGGNGHLIRRASPSDSGVYLCFQEGRLKGGFLLQVEGPKKRSLGYASTSGAMPISELVVMSFFSCSIAIVVWRLKMAARQEVETEVETEDGRPLTANFSLMGEV